MPGCQASVERGGWLPRLWASPLSHGPWKMFSGIENYRDWRLLSLMSDGSDAVTVAPDTCLSEEEQGLNCLLNIGGLINLGAPASHGNNQSGTIGDHIARTNKVPAQDSFASFWWQDFWETVYFLDGGLEEAYVMAADFHCRQRLAAASASDRRYYFVLMVQKGDPKGDPLQWTSDWAILSCKCGLCGKVTHTVE